MKLIAHLLTVLTLSVGAVATEADNRLTATHGTVLAVNKATPIGAFTPVEAECGYRFSGKIRAVDQPGRATLALAVFDREQKEIPPWAVNAIPGTETELSQPARKGERTLTVADASGWLAPEQGKIVIFNAKADLSDLPNRNLEYYLEKVQKSGSGWTLTMNRPLSRDYPAGVMLRQHRDGGWVTCGIPETAVSQDGETFSGTVLGAQPCGVQSDRWYRGAAFVKVLVHATVPVELTELKLEPLSDAEIRAHQEKRVLSGRKLKGFAAIFGAAKALPARDALEAVATGPRCGFYQMKLHWPCERIRQLEFTVMAEQPGYFRLHYTTMRDGKVVRLPAERPPHSVVPDGRYHTLIFDVSKHPKWQGECTNWELAWIGEPGKIGLSKVSAVAESNRIPDAAAREAGTVHPLNTLLPRARYRLRWQGATAPGVTLQFRDYAQREIPDSEVRLAAGAGELEFTTPELLIQGLIQWPQGGAGYPVLELLEYHRPFASSLNWRGQWLWHQREWGPFHARVWFEKTFDLDEVPEFATMALLADDTVDAYINGRFVAHAHPFWLPQRAEIAEFLKPGPNRMTFRVYNGTQNAGLLVNTYLKFKTSERFIDTDSSWRCDARSNSTAIPAKIDAPVVELGAPQQLQPWVNRIGYRYTGKMAELEPVKIEPGKLTVKVRSLPPVPVSMLNFELRTPDGKKHNLKLPIQLDHLEWKIDQVVTLTYPIPHWESGTAELRLRDDFVQLLGDPTLLKLEAAPPKKYEFQTASWVDSGKRLRLRLGDRVHSPIFWHGGRSVTLDRFHEFVFATANGIRNFRIPISFDDFWRGEGQYDFSKFDAVMNHVLTIAPDAIFSLQLYAHMPEWWLKLNPDDLTRHAHNRPRFADRDKQALASRKWLADARAPIQALLAHLRTRSFAPQIWGVLVAESGNGEWFWTNNDGNMKRSCPGYSAADHATFRAYLKEKYPDDDALAQAWQMPGVTLNAAPMPDPERAYQPSVGELLDAARDRQLVDWFEFRNRSLAEAIIALAKIIKDNTQNKLLIGAYYGYSIELAENGTRPLTITGHNAFEAVARSPYVDFVQAPSRYTYRKTGMSDALMQPADTFSAYGKAVFCEQDIRTAYGNCESDPMTVYVGRPDTPSESIGQIQRGFGMALATGTGMYWFDITIGALSEQALLEAIKKQLEVYDQLPAVQGLTPQEVAIVSDRDSIYYAPNANAKSVFTGAISGLFKRFNELAVPYRTLSIHTLLDRDAAVPPHKFYIMLPTLMLTRQQRQALLERFEREKAAVVWLYTAGCDYPESGPSADFCADFLGIKTRMELAARQPVMQTTAEFGNLLCTNYNTSSPWFYPVAGFDAILAGNAAGQPMLVRKNQRGATHYFSTLMNLPMPLYARLMHDAGVHRYRREITDPVWVGNDVLFLHAKSGGPKSFELPSGTRLRSIIGPFQGVLRAGESLNAEAGQTYGFQFERDDAR